MVEKIFPPILLKKVALSWRRALRNLVPLGGFSYGNSLWFYHHGDDAFRAIHRAISKAKESIYLETYIFLPDQVGILIRDALIERARAGLKVTVLYDHFGSANLRRNFIEPMLNANIEVLPFNPIWPWRQRGPLLFRDHRKIIVIDKKLAFCGSMNIGADYAGPIFGTDRFRDSILQIEGPAALDLLNITEESIAESKFSEGIRPEAQEIGSFRTSEIFKRIFSRSPILQEPAKDTMVQVLRSNTRRNLSHIQKSMEQILSFSTQYCYFTTPYFLPYGNLRKAIIEAAKRGVDVRILVAGLSDVPLMHWAMQHVYLGFLKEGVRIYEMDRKILHAKLSSIDGIYASIGSYNLDHWSARRNLEVNISILDRPIALSLKEQFERDLSLSKEIGVMQVNSRPWLIRLLCWFSYLIFRL